MGGLAGEVVRQFLFQPGQVLGLGHRVGQTVVGDPPVRHRLLSPGGDVIVQQDGVPRIGGSARRVAQFILEDLDAVAEIREEEVGAARFFTIGGAQPPGQTGKVQGGHLFLQDLQGDGQGLTAAADARLLLGPDRLPHVRPRPGQVRAFIQVLPLLDHLGGKGQAGWLAAITAIGPRQVFQDLHNGNCHAAQPRFPNFSSSIRPRLARCAFSSPARAYKTSLVCGCSPRPANLR